MICFLKGKRVIRYSSAFFYLEVGLNRFGKQKLRDVRESIMLEWEYERKSFIINSIFIVSFMYFFYNCIRVVLLFYELRYISVFNIFFALGNIIMTLLPFGLWVVGSSEEFFFYKDRKRRLFYYCCINFFVVVIKYAVAMASFIVIPNILSIKPGEEITASMLIWTCRIMLALVVVLCFFLLKLNVWDFINTDVIMNKIMDFNIKQVYDDRDNRENLYDQRIIREINTGEIIPFLYEDRFTQQIIQGSSGTGKTSTGVNKIIWGDFVTKYNNQTKRWAEYQKMLKNNEAVLLPSSDGSINPEKIEAFPEYREKLENIRHKYMNCGHTIIGPDEDLANGCLKFCKKFGYKYYLCDPTTDDEGNHKPNFKGINPYHISNGLSYRRYIQEVPTVSSLVSDALKAVFEESGSTDVYFSGVNSTLTVHISNIIIAGMPYVENREAKLTDLRRILLDFSRIKPCLDAVIQHFGGEEDNEFAGDIDYVKTSMLGDEKLREKLHHEANGLRNTLDLLLQIPEIREALCSDDPIDFKEVIDEGGIVFVNYGYKYGKTVAKGFGLFYVMMFHNEIKKRDSDDKFLTPHFEIVDEFSMLMHSLWEETITWLRKYKLASTLCFQSNAQFEKNELTKYMGNVIQGVGQIIAYGRIDLKGGEILGNLAGKELVDVLQNTVSQNSMLSENPTYSESVRNTPTREAYIDVSELRNTDFLVVTVFTIHKGKTLPPQQGKMFFVTEKEMEKVKITNFKWDKYISNNENYLIDAPVSAETLQKNGISIGEYTFGENDDKVDEKEENEGNGAGNVGTPEDAFSQYL